jgi:hypothetical protein
VYSVAIYEQYNPSKSSQTTLESLSDTLRELVDDSTDRVRSYLLHTDWQLHDYTISERQSLVRSFNITLTIIRHQYEGSSGKGLERLLTFIEGTLWGAHGFKVGADGDPVVRKSKRPAQVRS